MNTKTLDLTEGSIIRGFLSFTIPFFLGQLLQQLYNVADAWVVGNFASNEAFAAVSSSGTLIFLITGFVMGMTTGGGVVISRFFGAKDKKNTEIAIHTNFLFAIIASIVATVIGVVFSPFILRMIGTPSDVLPDAIRYFTIYFGGVSTIVFFNIGMSILRALGDSMTPLLYLVISSVLNIILDLIFVAGLHWGVTGAGTATVIAQGFAAVICVIHLTKLPDHMRLSFKKIRYNASMMRQVLYQGIPSGIQNSVISIGNIVVQANINSFGAYAMSGQGAAAKIEGFVFLPIMSLSLALPTFISQNLGAGKPERAKKCATFGLISGVITAELFGIVFFVFRNYFIRFFIDNEEAVRYGAMHTSVVSLFFFVLSFSHCAAGVLRGCGKAVIPMATMLSIWCVFRIIYVTIALQLRPEFTTISSCYPLTWILSSIVFAIVLFRLDFNNIYKKKE